MLDALYAAAKARWAERSTRVAVFALVPTVLVGLGWLTMDDVAAYADKIVAMIGVAGLVANAITPDGNKAIGAAAAADEAVDAALKVVTEAAEKAAGPGAREASLAVSNIIDKLL